MAATFVLVEIESGGTAGEAGAPNKGSKLYRYWVRLEEHHGLPQAFKDAFEAAGLNPNKFTVKMYAWKHRMKGIGIHSRGWNREWKKFLASPENRNPDRILNQLEHMIQKYGIGGGP